MVDISKKKGTKIGIDIYSRDEWEFLQKNSTDLKSESYEEWVEVIKKVKNRLIEKGINPIDIPINAKEMQDYFDKNNMENNGRNRAHYIALKLKEMDEEGKVV